MKIVNTILSTVKRNSPLILSSTAVAGVVSTAYLSGKASFRIKHEFDESEFYDVSRKDLVKKFWKFYIPTAASGAVTIACIVGSNRIGNRRAMAAQAAFILTERAYSEYRDTVVEELGEKTDQKIRDKLAEKKVKDNPPAKEVTVIAGGNVLCCELYTGRYFLSDMETLRKAQNDLNSMLIKQDFATMEEWYHMIGIQPTEFSSDVGWNADKMMELEFSTVLSEDGRPCLAFSYNYYRSLYDGTCP